MAGISGIIARPSGKDWTAEAEVMTSRLVHERFYRPGNYINKELGIFLGWATHEGSFCDCLPIWNETKDICLVLVGEAYPDAAEVSTLREKGHRFDLGDASYLVHSYEELGLRFLREINGLFSGILVDLRIGETFVFNDRYGFKRVYYTELDGVLLFSSEAKSILAVCPSTRQLDTISLGEFLSCGAVLQNRTLFKGISLMPGASVWSFSEKRLSKCQYFSISEWKENPILSTSNYDEKLRDTWSRVVPRYFEGSERASVSLTGGVDSRMILAWSGAEEGSVPTYTFGGRYRECADVKVAREVARRCGQPHQVISLGRDFLSAFPSMAERAVYISDGSMDVSGSIDLYLQRYSRQIAPARVSGTNGGEVLRRLVVFKPMTVRREMLAPELAAAIQEAGATYAMELEEHPLTFSAFKQTPWYMCSKFAIEQSQVTLRMPYMDNRIVSLAYQAPPGTIRSNDSSLRLIADGNPALADIKTDRGLVLRPTPIFTSLSKIMTGIAVKSEYAYDYGMPQSVAAIDHSLRFLRLERLFLGRHKFHHFRVWYRDELSAYVKEVLLYPAARKRPYLNEKLVEFIVQTHTQGKRNFTLEIHKLLTLELVQRQLLERN
jgi:asparagine synthase (glutamine-hydrolysing)